MEDSKEEMVSSSSLELQGVIGFNGAVRNGLILHPGDQHIIYPLGSTIVVKHLTENTQTFLQKGGHDLSVSCLTLSASGKYLASGQHTHMGFVAPIIIWDLETYEPVHRLELHKGNIQDLAFSHDEKYLVSLGGRDDNKIVVWDVEEGEAICGSPASNDNGLTVAWMNNTSTQLVSAGNYHVRVWDFDLATRKIRPHDCQLGQMKRFTNTVTVCNNDENLYCGTETGDVLQVNVASKLFRKSGPNKKARLFQNGITSMTKTHDGKYLIVGAGDGTVALLSLAEDDLFKKVRTVKFDGSISSLALNASGDHFFVGTTACNIYLVCVNDFDFELRNTCHSSHINGIAFPRGYSELFATCAANDIRVWHSKTRNELLRIQVPNLDCLCVTFSPDGKAIMSGWSDGKIRAFKPQTGKLMFCINDAHRDGVTALECTQDCRRLVSGGEDGQVRIWQLDRSSQKMIASLKEHKGRVSSLAVNPSGTECVSASVDGSCIIWNLEKFVRQNCLFANTKFMDVLYHPDTSQLLTTGTDRKLTYWDVVDGNPIRILDGSTTDKLTCLGITEDGTKFVTGGGDKLVQVWGYDEGYCYYTGYGHSGEIVRTAVSPDQETIISVGSEGAIFLWAMPEIEGLE